MEPRHGSNGLASGTRDAEQDLFTTLAFDGAYPDVERVLDAVLGYLHMEVAYVSEFVRGEEVYRILEGDPASFGLQRHAGLPLGHTYSQRLIDGRIPPVIPNAQQDDRVRRLYVTQVAGVGAYIGAPIVFASGRLYGAFGCFGGTPHEELGERDVKYVQMIARLIGDQLERRELELANWRLREEAVAIRALLAALEARDGYTGEHSKAVVDLSLTVASHLGLPEDGKARVEQLALLHDVGKIGIPDSILRKPGPLDAGEWREMKEHPVIGERIVSSLYGLGHLGPGIRAEHERWDGGGYPDALAGPQIPLASRIVLVCDAYHAMISDRPYRRALAREEALMELRENAGSQFCPTTVRALQEVLLRVELGDELEDALTPL
ncbi:MAG: HD domain-containing phosphohydrolase [Actinomycetota bacterium]